MTSPDPFPQFIPNRAEAALRRVEEQIWADRQPLVVEATRPSSTHVSLANGMGLPRRRVAQNSPWGRLYDQRWCRLDLTTTSPSSSGVRYLEWRDQGEATLYLNGVPHYGFDVAHRYAPLPEKAGEIWVESICCQSAIWHPLATGLSAQGSIFDGANLVRQNEEAWQAYHDLKCLFDVMMAWRPHQVPTPPAELTRFGRQAPVEKAPPVFRLLLHWLAKSIDAFDREGLTAMRGVLGQAYRELRDSRSSVIAQMTGHAHIDLVWLWPERIGEVKAVHTFATVNRLMELYPEFRFAYSQPASYRAVGKRSPELLESVRSRIKDGRWEATGALEVESDTQIPCGEALARSFLLGQADFRELRNGKSARLLWLPDVFGYSGCLPQLMKLAGVSWFFTTKMTWSSITRFPFSSFRWRGTDGSEVIAHITPDAGYNNRVDVGEIQAQAEGHAQLAVHPEFLHPTGYGDGGGGPTEEMCERVRRLDALAGMPALRWTQPEAFFARLERHADALPVYQGECYLEYHRGTYTTHGNLKAAYRGLERALQVREAVAVAHNKNPDLTATWRRLVFAQFHDYLPGSSVPDVYAEGVPELERLANEQMGAAQADLGGANGSKLRAFNPLTLPWSGWVSGAGKDAVWLRLGPLESSPVIASAEIPEPARIEGQTLDNGIVRAVVDKKGRLQQLSVQGRKVAFSEPAGIPIVYPDLPANYEAWDVDRHSLELGEPVGSAVKIVAENIKGSRAILAVSRAVGKGSTLVLRYILEAGASVLRLQVELDWHEPQTLLKLHFPTNYSGALARFGAPFGSVLRGQLPGSSAVEAQWEVPGSRWATVSNDGERDGLMLMTEAKYGFSARAGDLSVSLVRSPRMTGCDDHRYAAPRGLGRLKIDSPYSDQGTHVIELALGHYDLGAPRASQPAALAETLFTAPLVYSGHQCGSGFKGLEGGETLVPAWAVPLGEKKWVLRLHECGGQEGSAVIKLLPGWTAQACSLDGKPTARLPASRVRFRPYEIVSVLLSQEA